MCLPDYYNWRCHEKKKKIKVVKNMIQHASSDILTSLGESQFQTRKCYFWHDIENPQSTASKNLRILPLNKAKSTKYS